MIEKLAIENDLFIIEDAAQGFGGKIGVKKQAHLAMWQQRHSSQLSL
jgi:dTDP-4-amino-4,6-dideoxygalactose transaminase